MRPLDILHEVVRTLRSQVTMIMPAHSQVEIVCPFLGIRDRPSKEALRFICGARTVLLHRRRIELRLESLPTVSPLRTIALEAEAPREPAAAVGDQGRRCYVYQFKTYSSESIVMPADGL